MTQRGLYIHHHLSNEHYIVVIQNFILVVSKVCILGEQYGIIQIHGQNTTFWTYEDKRDTKEGSLTRLSKYCVKLQQNHSMGGQSQNRIERLRQESIMEYLKLVNDKAIRHFIKTSEGEDQPQSVV